MSILRDMKLSGVIDNYSDAQRRLILLDYDGTLTPIVARPEDAKPSQELLDLLRKLSADDKNTIVIISGRPRETLEDWLGDLSIEFVAEHSVWRREKTGLWAMTIKPDDEQIATATTMLASIADTHPGTLLEEKHVGIALHYRHAPTLDDDKIRQWAQTNMLEIQKHKLRTIHGKKIIELVPDNVDKGTAAKYWLNRAGWDFILIAGDDTTDEAMFDVAPIGTVTIHVGEGDSIAKLGVNSPADFINLLTQMNIRR